MIVVQFDGRAHHLGQSRQHTHPEPHPLQGPGRVQQVIGDSSSGRDDRALDPFCGEQTLQVVVSRPAVVPVDAVRARAVPAEGQRQRRSPDYRGFQPGRLTEPAHDPLCRLGVAQDQASLLAGEFSGHVSGESPNRDHAREQQRPDPNRLVAAEAAIDDLVPGQEDEERVESGDPEEGGDLIERRLPDQVLVAVVEPSELSDNEHQRKCEERNRVEGIVAQDRHADQHGDRRRGEISDSKATAIDRVASADRPPQPALGDLPRLVARREPADPGERREGARRIIQLQGSADVRVIQPGIQL